MSLSADTLASDLIQFINDYSLGLAVPLKRVEVEGIDLKVG